MNAPAPGAAPGRRWLEPELATLTSDRFSDPAWIYERKFDGERCIAYRSGELVSLLTRNRQDVSTTYPEIREALRAQACADFVCDGEVVAFDGAATSFARLQQRLGVRDPAQELVRRVPVLYYVFDVLAAGDRDVRALPLGERKDVLRDLLAFADPVRLTEHRTGNGEKFWIYACEQGWEGLIAKRASAPYRAGRTRDWLKFKCEASQELVIVGYTDPRGSRSGLGALLLAYYQDGQLSYAGKVGTGFSQAVLADLLRELQPLERRDPAAGGKGLPRTGVHWVEPSLVAQVGFSEWTTAGQLRHPRYQGLRRDKDPASVVREVPRSAGA
jgi:bifunctional non-homologous end joining protein LigD